MKKILIIGKKSFLGTSLNFYLSKFFNVDKFSLEQVLKKRKNFFDKYSHIINTAIHKDYIKKKYNSKFDLDKKFIKKFDEIKFYYLFMNSRKIYYPGENLKESSKISPVDIYGKNKYLTERYLKKKIKNRLISLRISNVIGKRFPINLRNNHKLFFDNFLKFRKSKKKIIVYDEFKDFISIKQFSKIIYKIIKNKLTGTYNVSLGEKIYVSEIVKWLDPIFFKKVNFIKSSKNSFTLSNKKLLKKIKISIGKKELKSFCKNLIR